MGVLYRARDTILDREVALKTIAGTGGLDPELKERFYREARASARLHHPNVITVYELGEQEGLVFIALELLSGCDLRQFIAQRLPFRRSRKSPSWRRYATVSTTRIRTALRIATLSRATFS